MSDMEKAPPADAIEIRRIADRIEEDVGSEFAGKTWHPVARLRALADVLDTITREAVEMCLSSARHWEGIADNSHEWGHRETQYEWERLAAKLAALFPPSPAPDSRPSTKRGK